MEWKTIGIIGIVLASVIASLIVTTDEAQGFSVDVSGSPPSHTFSGCEPLAQVNVSGSFPVSLSAIESIVVRSGAIFAGGAGGILSMIDIRSGSWRNTSTGSDINSIAILLDGRAITVAGADGKLRVYDTASLVLVKTLSHGATNVWALASSNDTIVSGGGDRRIIFWNITTGAEELEVKASSSVRALSIQGDGKVAVGLYNGDVSVIDPVSHNLTRLYAHTSVVRAVAWSGNGSMLASVSSDKTFKIWRADGNITTVNAASSGVYGVAWSGDEVITAATDEHVKAWSANGSMLRDFKLGASVHTVSAEGSRFAAGDIKGKVTLFSDTASPVLLSGSVIDALTNSTSIRFQGVFSECVTVGNVSVSPVGWLENSTVATSEQAFSGSIRLRSEAPDGTYDITLNDVRDRSNNSASNLAVGEFVLDRTRPYVINLTQSHQSPLPIGIVRFAATFSKRMVGNTTVELVHNGTVHEPISLNWSSDGLTFQSSFEFTPQMESGEYELRVRGGKDIAGNAMVPFNATLAYDSEPPVAEAGADVAIERGDSMTLDASNSTGASRFAWSIRGRSYPGKVIVHKFSFPGLYNVTLTAYDDAGNTGIDHVMVHVLDADPPNMSVDNPKKLTNGDAVIIRYNISDDGGVASVEVRCESNVSKPENETKDYSGRTVADDLAKLPLSMDGAYTMTVKACDVSGNCNSTVPFGIVRDSTPPQLVSHTPDIAASTDVKVTLAFTEPVNISGVACSKGALPTLISNHGIKVDIGLRNLTYGENYTLFINGSDEAGNGFSESVSFETQGDASEIIAPAVGFFCTGFSAGFLIVVICLRRRGRKPKKIKSIARPASKETEGQKDEVELAIQELCGSSL